MLQERSDGYIRFIQITVLFSSLIPPQLDGISFAMLKGRPHMKQSVEDLPGSWPQVFIRKRKIPFKAACQEKAALERKYYEIAFDLEDHSALLRKLRNRLEHPVSFQQGQQVVWARLLPQGSSEAFPGLVVLHSCRAPQEGSAVENEYLVFAT